MWKCCRGACLFRAFRIGRWIKPIFTKKQQNFQVVLPTRKKIVTFWIKKTIKTFWRIWFNSKKFWRSSKSKNNDEKHAKHASHSRTPTKKQRVDRPPPRSLEDRIRLLNVQLNATHSMLLETNEKVQVLTKRVAAMATQIEDVVSISGVESQHHNYQSQPAILRAIPQNAQIPV